MPIWMPSTNLQLRPAPFPDKGYIALVTENNSTDEANPTAVLTYGADNLLPGAFHNELDSGDAWSHFASPLRGLGTHLAFEILLAWTYFPTAYDPPEYNDDGDIIPIPFSGPIDATAEIYLMETDWNPATLNWNNQPAFSGRKITLESNQTGVVSDEDPIPFGHNLTFSKSFQVTIDQRPGTPEAPIYGLAMRVTLSPITQWVLLGNGVDVTGYSLTDMVPDE